MLCIRTNRGCTAYFRGCSEAGATALRLSNEGLVCSALEAHHVYECYGLLELQWFHFFKLTKYGPYGVNLNAGIKQDLGIGLCRVICPQELGIILPRRGTGKSGNVIKRDVGKALVTGVFPDLSEEEVNKMVDAICGEISERDSPIPETTTQETLKLISAIDPQEKESFKELIMESLDKLAADEKNERNASSWKPGLKQIGLKNLLRQNL